MLTAITLPNDDAAVLKDTKAITPRTVSQVQPFPTVQPRDGSAEAPKPPVRKLSQRRKAERRKTKDAVLLDTRSGHDRRNIIGGEEVRVEGATKMGAERRAATGVNVYS
ncbi:MAG: hypothetical protein GXP17_06960 [Gammaproteobacteria bacterium]|nr:hypothetical protein [Gammaproteobacteria bacterium]